MVHPVRGPFIFIECVPTSIGITSNGVQKAKISNGVNPQAYLTDTSDGFVLSEGPIVL